MVLSTFKISSSLRYLDWKTLLKVNWVLNANDTNVRCEGLFLRKYYNFLHVKDKEVFLL